LRSVGADDTQRVPAATAEQLRRSIEELAIDSGVSSWADSSSALSVSPISTPRVARDLREIPETTK